MLIWAQSVFYPFSNASDAARGLNALSDQNLAGAAMLIEHIILTTVLLGWLFNRFARQGARVAPGSRSERGTQPTDDRARRAGSADRLRERPMQTAPGRVHIPAIPGRLPGRTPAFAHRLAAAGS